MKSRLDAANNVHRGHSDPGVRRPNTDSVNNRFTSWARILVVEDQDDVRRMLVTALELEGHVVDEASNAAEGLRCLEQTRYDLVLSDYAMPGGTGSWMLHEASRQGLLNGTVALIVTAHPDIRELADIEVVSKPLDLDQFLEQVRRILGSPPPSAAANDGGSVVPGDAPRQSLRSGRHHVELVLYVSSASPASMQARRNLEQLLQRFDRSKVKFSVCDLSRDPLGGDADRVAFTPTLVKRYPEPRMWVLGSLKDTGIVADLLHACGVAAKTSE
jgi:two-component system response regulator GlrR